MGGAAAAAAAVAAIRSGSGRVRSLLFRACHASTAAAAATVVPSARVNSEPYCSPFPQPHSMHGQAGSGSLPAGDDSLPAGSYSKHAGGLSGWVASIRSKEEVASTELVGAAASLHQTAVMGFARAGIFGGGGGGRGCCGGGVNSSSSSREFATGSGAPARSTGGSGIPAVGQKAMKPEGVRHVIAVASGKGGVGKSTTAVNIAAALAHGCGLQVGILDADVYGPSIPRLLNLRGRPQVIPGTRQGGGKGASMLGMHAYGLTCMSMGFLMDDSTAAVWRGPMVMSALEQMLWGTRWGPLDVLVVDMPPGTGDAQITISQRVALSGAVIVSTPQDIALLDARRGAAMFQKVNVPILGVVENMSYFQCPKCNERTHIFSHGGARVTATELGLEFLGEIPLEVEIRELSDEGWPIVVAQPGSSVARAYKHIAERIMQKIDSEEISSAPQVPRIVIE